MRGMRRWAAAACGGLALAGLGGALQASAPAAGLRGAAGAPAAGPQARSGATPAPAAGPRARSGATPAPGVPPIRHVFVIVLENKEYAETFVAGKQYAPYLTRTLPAEGALVPNYFGTGHSSADNYIAMVGGQPPTTVSKEDCPDPLATLPTTSDANGVAQGGGGCVYPSNFKTIGDQLAARHLKWKAYAQNIPSPCSLAHDAPGNYARKHNPFPFFLSVRESGQCAQDDVGLDELGPNLKHGTANVSYVFPDECADGHSDCTAGGSKNPAEEQQHELEQTDAFLHEWVPRIKASHAYRQNGLIAIVWDEGDETRACCGEPEKDPDGSSPGSVGGVPGAGGGQTGAVLLSPFIKPGTTSESSYNHYSLLASIEKIFGLSRLGEANLPSTTTFGSDIFTAG